MTLLVVVAISSSLTFAAPAFATKDNRIRVWNFTSAKRSINGTVYEPGQSGVVTGNTATVDIKGCDSISFTNPFIGRPYFKFSGSRTRHDFGEDHGARLTYRGHVYFVSRFDDTGNKEWELVVLKC